MSTSTPAPAARTSNDHAVAGPPVGKGPAAAAGVAAAAVALGVSELLAGALGSGLGLISGVGNWFINIGAGSLKQIAVQLFGTYDKPALIVGIVTVTLGLGAAVGLAARRRWVIGVASFVGFGIFAVLAATSASPGSQLVMSALGVAAVAAGLGTLRWVLAAARPAPTSPNEPGRRVVLRSGAALAAAAAAGVAGQGLRSKFGPADPAGGPAGAKALGDLPDAPIPHPVPTQQPFSLNGLSPYMTPTKDFYRIDTALVVPQIDARTWSLTIDGEVDRPLTLSYAELSELATTIEPVTLSCVSNEVGGDLVGNAVWQGVPLTTLLERAGVRASGTQIMGHSDDGFTAGFPTELARDGRVAMVALTMNGEPLPIEHGFPARIVVAGLYGYVSAVKWLTRIELVGWDAANGYWIPRGWSKLGPVKTQSRIDVPRSGAKVGAKSNGANGIDVGGVAWAPSRGISAVEVQIDGGDWRRAELGVAASGNTWVQWRYRWSGATPGSHIVRVRATDGTGAVQTAEPSSVAPNGATGHHTVTITVTA